jgi:hypothetical protein
MIPSKEWASSCCGRISFAKPLPYLIEDLGSKALSLVVYDGEKGDALTMQEAEELVRLARARGREGQPDAKFVWLTSLAIKAGLLVLDKNSPSIAR